MGRKERIAEGAAERAAQRARIGPVLALVEEAFEGVPPPDREHRTLFQAEAWDSYERVDQSRDHRGPWQDLPEAHLSDCGFALPHLDAQGIRYYLPAIMTSALQARRPLLIHDALRFTLVPSVGDLKDYQRRRIALLTFSQRQAILAFLEALDDVTEEELRPWRRVVEAGDDPSWLDRFY